MRLVDGGKFWPARPLSAEAAAIHATPAPAPVLFFQALEIVPRNFPSPGKLVADFFQCSENSPIPFPSFGKTLAQVVSTTFPVVLWRTDGGGQGHARTRNGTCCARRSLRRRRVMALARHSAALRYGATGLRRLRLDGREFYATRRHGNAAALQHCGWLHRIKSSSANSADPRRPSARLPLRSKLGPFAPSVPRDWRQ